MEFLAQFHPKIVHFAVAFIFLYGCFEIAGVFVKGEYIRRTAHLLLLIGVVAALGAVLSGHQAEDAWDNWNQQKSDLLDVHETFANIVLWLSAFVLVVRTYLLVRHKYTRKVNYIFAIPALILIIAITIVGDRGGKMVYENGVGVKTNSTQHEELNQKDNIKPQQFIKEDTSKTEKKKDE